MAHSEKEYFGIYAEKCLRCKHLVETAKVEHTDCHFSKGNTYCPASEVKIVVVGQAHKLAKRLAKARDERDPEAESDIMKVVNAKSKAFQSKFYDFLESSNGD